MRVGDGDPAHFSRTHCRQNRLDMHGIGRARIQNRQLIRTDQIAIGTGTRHGAWVVGCQPSHQGRQLHQFARSDLSHALNQRQLHHGANVLIVIYLGKTEAKQLEELIFVALEICQLIQVFSGHHWP
jgi:hypothetical protein